MDSVDPDQLMYDRAVGILTNPDATAQELEWARKALNDYNSRVGLNEVKRHQVQSAFDVNQFKDVEFDDVPIRQRVDGAGA